MLAGTLCRIRPYRRDDAATLPAIADDPWVARWMNPSRFPSPYTRADADAWVRIAMADDPPRFFVIEVEGEHAGGIGLDPSSSAELVGVAHIGYWLGRRFWGRGIATDAARALARYAFDARAIRRLETTVYVPNAASARVLEKAGFTLEGRLRSWLTLRDGSVHDGLLYARLASDPEPDGTIAPDPESARR